jgi:hypothetical protein
MKKFAIIFSIVFLSLFASQAVKANNSPYEKLYENIWVNYLNTNSLNLKWNSSCVTNEYFIYKNNNSNSETKLTPNCYDSSLGYGKECQIVLNNLEVGQRYDFGGQCGSDTYQLNYYFTTPYLFLGSV